MHYEKGLHAKCSQVSNNAFVNENDACDSISSLGGSKILLSSIFRINFYSPFSFLFFFLFLFLEDRNIISSKLRQVANHGSIRMTYIRKFNLIQPLRARPTNFRGSNRLEEV